jgi:hypothetical protein
MLKSKILWNFEIGIYLVLLVVFVVLGFNSRSFAEPTTSTGLINNAKEYDTKTVTYSGEVIGDVMARGEYAWININDGKNAIGVWLPKDLTQDILYTGTYRSRGDWIEVTGIFHRVCLEHGGDLDIHAQQIRRIIPGREKTESLNLGKRNLALALLGVLCLALILRQLRSR